jgi:hypothetical protein
MARAGDVADWWMRRGAVRVTMLPPEADSAAPELAVGDTVAHTARGFPVVRVEAPTGAGIARLWVDVVLPVGPNSAAPFVDGVPISYSTTEWGIRVPVGDLSAGETRVIHLRPAEEG